MAEERLANAGATETIDPIRLGVIGAGWFASRRHMPDAAASPDIAIAAICRRDEEARARIAAKFEIPPDRTFADWREMLNNVELDAVLIATPNALHYEQAKSALERGLHVLLEKPMTIRGADARDLVSIAKDRNVKLGVSLNPPYWAHCHRIRRALADPAMGELESVSLYFAGSADYVFGRAPAPEDLPGVVPPTMYRADPEMNGGGYFIDGGAHLVSELLWVTNLRVKRVACIMDSLPTDMRIAMSLELENGAVATLNTIGDSRASKRRVRVAFGATAGMVTVNGFEFDTTIQLPDRELQRFRESDLLPVPGPIANFADAILGRAELASPGEHGAHVVEVVEAAYESARTGHIVEIPDFA